MTDVSTKTCRKCLEEKPLDEFYFTSKKTKTGVRRSPTSYCKLCFVAINRQRYLDNAEARKERQRKYRKDNPEKVREGFRKWRDKNYEAWLEGAKRYRENNPEKLAAWRALNKDKLLANCAKRRSFRINATPAWLTSAHMKSMADYYWLAKDATSVSETSYHVDHIIPLNNDHVCGLHVPWNLQVLPADVNISKSNSFECWWID